jgi:hypothetical protein
MSRIGRNSDVLSSVGKRIDMNSGAASPRVNKGVPQSEQKLRVARLPLPARTEYVFGVPLISTSDDSTIKPEAKGAPLERWHRDWRTRTHIADRSACAPAGERSNHVAVFSSRLTMRLSDARLHPGKRSRFIPIIDPLLGLPKT